VTAPESGFPQGEIKFEFALFSVDVLGVNEVHGHSNRRENCVVILPFKAFGESLATFPGRNCSFDESRAEVHVMPLAAM